MVDTTEYASIIAVADLVARTGATAFEIGYVRDDPKRPGWWATARLRGWRITVEERLGPDEAADALARKILTGGTCTECHRVVTLDRHKGGCLWHRDGESWVRGCDGKRKATKDGVD